MTTSNILIFLEDIYETDCVEAYHRLFIIIMTALQGNMLLLVS